MIERPYRWPAAVPTNEQRWAAVRDLYAMERAREMREERQQRNDPPGMDYEADLADGYSLKYGA